MAWVRIGLGGRVRSSVGFAAPKAWFRVRFRV